MRSAFPPPREWPRSAWALLAGTIVPLAGVLALGWDLAAVMILFWAENAVIGVFHVMRLALVTGRFGLFLVPFFTVHYGMFTLVHGMFVVGLFLLMPLGGEAPDVWRTLAIVLPGVVALFASHGYSFVTNFLRGGERERMRAAMATLKFRRTGRDTWEGDVAPEELANEERLRGFHDVGELMTGPYRRVVVMHLTIMGGGLLLIVVGSPLPALVLLVALKAIVDLRAHLRERKRGQVRPTPDATPV